MRNSFGYSRLGFAVQMVCVHWRGTGDRLALIVRGVLHQAEKLAVSEVAARYRYSLDPQREIQEGLNVVEGWNGANDVIFLGKGGDLISNRRDQQELAILVLHLLQTALVYVNTLTVQDLLAEPEWADRLAEEDQRGLTPLFWSHIQPYGEVRLNMSNRLNLTAAGGGSQTPEPAAA
ncbi:hypothetical protein GCM10023205_42130 [Yinghuangia aomiensis]|uniref:Tn3 transposase DDE domain-containing protein n=1 Tax=Yinghuangia aomiensis TaxID=676205 RepID=A0ABP9HIG7_9ACTN